jgi:hypothetical protein
MSWWRLNREFFMGVNEAQVFAFGPPAIPGLGSGSGFTMMIQDRAGNTPAYLAEQTDPVHSRRQRHGLKSASVVTTFRPSVPQRFMEINRDKVLKAGVALNDIYTTVGAFLGGSYVNDFNRFGRLYKAYIQAEPEYRISEDRINLFFVKNKNGEGAPERLRQHQGGCRSGLHQPLQPLSIHRTDRRTGPRLYLCPGAGRPRSGGRNPAGGHGLRLEQHVLSGEASLGYGGRCFRLLPAVRFPDSGGPVRKLVAAHEHSCWARPLPFSGPFWPCTWPA